ncbi:hypothetical protein EJ08DRAFT_725200 [Tothia fuscella]|uniref:Uncharacterized protein n=1 Tax=Tothia fuscella TaxID=1048955 RepID=A0A9P4NIR9_9PEZI|nr:hypothetical protein EJ08DRAFT_725200 [Tothia fuscella]
MASIAPSIPGWNPVSGEIRWIIAYDPSAEPLARRYYNHPVVVLDSWQDSAIVFGKRGRGGQTVDLMAAQLQRWGADKDDFLPVFPQLKKDGIQLRLEKPFPPGHRASYINVRESFRVPLSILRSTPNGKLDPKSFKILYGAYRSLEGDPPPPPSTPPPPPPPPPSPPPPSPVKGVDYFSDSDMSDDERPADSSEEVEDGK